MRNITLIVGQFDSFEENSISNSHKGVFGGQRRPAVDIKRKHVASDRRRTSKHNDTLLVSQ